MLRIREMTLADIPFGMQLKIQAGWNQVEADWRRLLDLQPHGCFLAELDGLPAGTVATCRFGPVAWIAMMLVDPSFRSHGIGRALMTRALAELDSAGVHTVRLDATPLGLPLYASLDFTPDMILSRFLGVLPPANHAPSPYEPPTSETLAGVLALDRQVTGTERRRLLRRLIIEQPGSLRVAIDAGTVTGFLLARPGSKARRIGPCSAGEHIGARLLDTVWHDYAGETVAIDIPTDHAPAVALVGSWGLSVSGVLTRMSRGPRITEDLARLWVSSGPEKG